MLTRWSQNKWVFAAVIFIAGAATAEGQVLQTARYELPVVHRDRDIETVPTGTGGLLLFRHHAGLHDDLLYLTKIDTAFNDEWSGYIQLQKGFRMAGSKSLDEKMYFLLLQESSAGRNFLILELDEHTGQYKPYELRTIIPIRPAEFHPTGAGALIGGYFNRVPVVMFFSFATLTAKILPGLFNDDGELTQIKTYDNGTFDVLISARNFSKQRTIWLKNYDAHGDLLRQIALQPGDDRHLIFGRAVKTQDDHQLVAGVYGNLNAEYSRGLFVAHIAPDGRENIRYYNFGDLEHFFSYMKARREMRIKARIERRRIRGKKVRFNYRFLVHQFIPYNGNYILLGEAFYPKYRYPQTSFNSYGQHMARIFDGYVYTHAVVMCFTPDGKLLWDNSFEINDVKTFQLEQFVKIESRDDRIVLFYLFDNAIRTKVIQGDQVLEGKSIDPIRTFSEREFVSREGSEGKLEYWYDNHLFAYGIQEISAQKSINAPKRRVFYVNKVTYAHRDDD